MKRFALWTLCSLASCSLGLAGDKPNILVLTVDDMNCDSVGVFGCEVEGSTPNMDKFATESMRFAHAHVHASSCIPSRNTVMTGRFMFNSGVEGFYAVPKEKVQYRTTPDILRDNGYFTIIRGKSHHSMPYNPYPAWDINFDEELKASKVNTRHPQTFYDYTLKGIEAAKKAEKPFYYSMDIHDPHTALYGFSGKDGKGTKHLRQDKDNPPSRIFSPEEIKVPKFLPDTPLSRREVAAYYSSVRRADDSFGRVIQALKDAGVYENTLIVFFSDHGMPFPFAKTAMYYHSTHTPLMVRVPELTRPGTVDTRHVVGMVDLLPTLMELTDLPVEPGLDGRSFAPILHGDSQDGRDFTYVMYEENVGGNRQPMRAVVAKDFTYICNLWSDGERRFSTATRGMASYAEIERLARAGNQHAQQRLELFLHSVPEQLFDINKDPDGLDNLMANPEYTEQLQKMQAQMLQTMEQHQDPIIDVFRSREDVDAVAKYLKQLDRESLERRKDIRFSRNGKLKVKKKKSKGKK